MGNGYYGVKNTQGVYFITVLWADFLEGSDEIGFSGLLGNTSTTLLLCWF